MYENSDTIIFRTKKGVLNEYVELELNKMFNCIENLC